MSYDIKFKARDMLDITVSTERGEKIKALVFDGQKDTPIDIDGDMYLIGDIKAVVRVPDPAPPKPPVQAALPSGPKCKGQYSIQLEIIKIANEVSNKVSDDNPDGLKRNKLLLSKSWKEQMRKKLRAMPGVQWCDGKAGECVCDPDKSGPGLDAVRQVFGGGIND